MSAGSTRWGTSSPAGKGHGSSALRVLAAAHMDEVGLMVTQIEDTGLLRFAKVGGIDDRVLPARAVLVGDGRVPGVIGSKPVHLTEKAERDKVIDFKQLAIDIGASSKGEAERLVRRGDCAVFATDFLELASTGSWRAVRGKALDDRVGCALLVELLKEKLPFELVAAFTVQEEVGLRGARVAAYAEDPDAAVVLECTAANEVPTRKDVSPSTRLGGRPGRSRSWTTASSRIRGWWSTFSPTAARARASRTRSSSPPSAEPMRGPSSVCAAGFPPSPSPCPRATSIRRRPS